MLLLSVPARAAPSHEVVALEYSPSATTVARCPAAEFLRNEVQIRIGYDLFQPGATERLTVKIARQGGAYRVTGELRGEEGDVTLTGSFTEVECGAAIRSLAIAVAIRFTRLPEACAPDRASAKAPLAPAPPASPPARPARLRPQIGIASVVSVGVAPVVVGGASFFVGVRAASLSASLEGRALIAPSTTLVGPRVEEGYRFLAVAVTAAGCVHPGWAFACFQVAWGSLSIGNAAVDVDPDRLFHVGLGFRFGGELSLTPAIALRAHVETGFNQSPYNSLRVPTTSARAIWRAPIFSGSLGLGPVISF